MVSNRLENKGEMIRKEIATNGYMTCDTTVDRYTRPPGQVSPASGVRLSLELILSPSLHGSRFGVVRDCAGKSAVLGSLWSFGVFRDEVLFFSGVIGLSRRRRNRGVRVVKLGARMLSRASADRVGV